MAIDTDESPWAFVFGIATLVLSLVLASVFAMMSDDRAELRCIHAGGRYVQGSGICVEKSP